MSRWLSPWLFEEPGGTPLLSSERNTRMIDGFPLSFFLPLVVHSLAGLTTAITGIVAFSAPKRRGRHDLWGTCYLWAYTVVFFTATILTAQRWDADAPLFFLVVICYGVVLAVHA